MNQQTTKPALELLSAYVNSRNVSAFTQDGFVDEKAALEAFDVLVERSGAFSIRKEVVGHFIQPRPGTGESSVRLDRLLTPTKKSWDHGWRTGAIGVEAKTSGKKLGPLITQAMDYTRCYFVLPEESPAAGLWVIPRWIFIYPVSNPHGDLESLMVNNRVGHCTHHEIGGLTFGCSGMTVIHIDPVGNVRMKNPTTGNKRGSR